MDSMDDLSAQYRCGIGCGGFQLEKGTIQDLACDSQRKPETPDAYKVAREIKVVREILFAAIENSGIAAKCGDC